MNDLWFKDATWNLKIWDFPKFFQKKKKSFYMKDMQHYSFTQINYIN